MHWSTIVIEAEKFNYTADTGKRHLIGFLRPIEGKADMVGMLNFLDKNNISYTGGKNVFDETKPATINISLAALDQ